VVAFHGNDRGQEIASLVDDMAPELHAQERPLLFRNGVQHAGYGFGIVLDRPHEVVGGRHAVEKALGREAAAQIEAGNEMPLLAVKMLSQRNDLLRGGAVCLRSEDIGADMRVDRMKTELLVSDHAGGCAFSFSIRQRETEFRPDRPDAGVKPYANTDV